MSARRPDPFDLTGKVAVVTGANAGIGLGFATGIARAGGDVAIWGRRAERNEDAAERLRAYGGRVLAQAVDVSDERAVAAAFDDAVTGLGRIDCVIANAGIFTRPASFHEMSSETYHDLLAINQHGALYTLRAGVRHMVERAEAGDPGGSLIVSGSAAAIVGAPSLQHYAAAKGALAAVMRATAVEYGAYGIRANMVIPGWVDTDLGDRTDEVKAHWAERMRTQNPIPRAGAPEDFEAIAVYLMGDGSSYHTGDLIVIDGGMTIS